MSKFGNSIGNAMVEVAFDAVKAYKERSLLFTIGKPKDSDYKEIWIPRSQINNGPLNTDKSPIIVEIPMWLAHENELI